MERPLCPRKLGQSWQAGTPARLRAPQPRPSPGPLPAIQLLFRGSELYPCCLVSHQLSPTPWFSTTATISWILIGELGSGV